MPPRERPFPAPRNSLPLPRTPPPYACIYQRFDHLMPPLRWLGLPPLPYACIYYQRCGHLMPPLGRLGLPPLPYALPCRRSRHLMTRFSGDGMEVVAVSFKHLLFEITQKLSLSVPKYGFIVDPSGQLSAYVDVDVEHGDAVIETIRSWALRLMLPAHPKRMQPVYRDLYQQLSDRYNALVTKHNTLKWDHKFLKECYGKAIDERDRYCAERSEIHQSLERVVDMIAHPGMVVDVPVEGAAQEPSAAQDPFTAFE
uniref:Uncharacterized protein n=1 Tax=Ananas comosus var. bracteatus TaxID=296719 RepID=A0A6V7NXL9_ANACO|nr:unnamed protein product [Ananas comosus var. bracteatus]